MWTNDEALGEVTTSDVVSDAFNVPENVVGVVLLVQLPLRSITYNKITFKDGTLALHVSKDFIYFTKDDAIIHRLVVDRVRHLESVKFGTLNRLLLVEFKSRRGYVYAKYQHDDAELVLFFNSQRHWGVSPSPRYTNDDLLLAMGRIDDGLHRALLELPVSRTRSGTASRTGLEFSQVTNEDGSITLCEPEPEAVAHPQEQPADFEPDLKHSFSHNKNFSISYSDFKTLYNNDWINDLVIDFFIAYEIDRAIQNDYFKQLDIYAFNSFFFTKLMLNADKAEAMDYYTNVKRWVSKLDLMSYPYVILPICENLHWYGCVIRGLPNLLKPPVYEEDPAFSESSTSSPSKPGFSTKHGNVADIYVFDSLSQKHANIHFPLRSFIMDYCLDKYNVDVAKDRIRIHSAKVPKQNNFNDCGIHVIYNVRKFLNNPNECEKVWRSHSKFLSRSFFLLTERNGLRRELINLLLELHKKQLETPQEARDPESEDEIEVISYNPGETDKSENGTTEKVPFTEVADSQESHPQEASEKKEPSPKPEPKAPQEGTSAMSSQEPLPPISPLQPRKTRSHNEPALPEGYEHRGHDANSRRLKNKSLREIFLNKSLSLEAIAVFNKLFPEKLEKFNTEQSSLIIDLERALKTSDSTQESAQKADHFLEVFHALGKLSQYRPRKLLFVIHEDPGDDLNHSVHRLRITSLPEVDRDRASNGATSTPKKAPSSTKELETPTKDQVASEPKRQLRPRPPSEPEVVEIPYQEIADSDEDPGLLKPKETEEVTSSELRDASQEVATLKNKPLSSLNKPIRVDTKSTPRVLSASYNEQERDEISNRAMSDRNRPWRRPVDKPSAVPIRPPETSPRGRGSPRGHDSSPQGVVEITSDTLSDIADEYNINVQVVSSDEEAEILGVRALLRQNSYVINKHGDGTIFEPDDGLVRRSHLKRRRLNQHKHKQ